MIPRRPPLASVRRFYWKRIRRHRYEICGTCAGGPGQAVIHAYGCGRPIGRLWRAPTWLWNFVVAGQDHTIYTVRPGAATPELDARSEGVGGILCADCFDRAADDAGVPLMWAADGLNGFGGVRN